MPPAVYDATVFNCEMKTGKDSGQPYLNWEFNIQTPGFEKRKAWYITSLQPNALWNLKSLLEAITGEEVPEGPIEFEPNDLFGRPCKLSIKNEDYQGKTVDKVEYVLSSSATATAVKKAATPTGARPGGAAAPTAQAAPTTASAPPNAGGAAPRSLFKK